MTEPAANTPDTSGAPTADPAAVAVFLERWGKATGSERANYQLFLTELTELLGLPKPEPSHEDTADNGYVFERKVTFRNADGSTNAGFIDLYKRGCFVLEAKQTSKALDTPGWDNAMLRAHGQAQGYARALPADEGRPPFVVVVDVGRNIELYSEFSRSGATYVPFPDPRSHRIRLEELAAPETQAKLRLLWTDPLALDPARVTARVTKAIAADLAKLAEGLEAAGHTPDGVASFLMRCLFTMFAEDVGLLPEASFTLLLEESRKDPSLFERLVPGLWRVMNDGGWSPDIRADVLQFNGGLFREQTALALDRDQLDLLLAAARADWRHVEPAIFGTLLERALDPRERHKLGAHYTPRAYVERLVMPTVIEPLREEWANAQATALTYQRQGRTKEAVQELTTFHDRLCGVRVLDPACGSGNFLYVTLEHLKRLEGEVFNALDALGHKQRRLEDAGLTVDPHQMLGLETNPRAARIAEAVLWIGYLQWHFRTHGDTHPPQPLLRDFHNIEHRDAVLTWDRIEYELDDDAKPVMRWDGHTTKTHPVTGKQVPDETATVPVERYVNPRKAEWPKADFVVGNPPFIGASRMRQALGDGYVEALREVHTEVPESADYVMYWWHHAAELLRARKIRQFGFITTNSLRQTFNRRVVQHHLEHKKPISLVFAIPDHPWVDTEEGAAVRIAMTVAAPGKLLGKLFALQSEHRSDSLSSNVALGDRTGVIKADLRVGADISGAKSLQANSELSSPGVKLHSTGFQVSRSTAQELGLGTQPKMSKVIRQYRNGRDLTKRPRDSMVIDLFGKEEHEVRSEYPEIYQHLLDSVRPSRQARAHTKDGATYAKFWWQFGKPRKALRDSLRGLPRYTVTAETSKHRFFAFFQSQILPDNMLTAIALDNSEWLCVLSSRVHVLWALAAGGRLGVGNDPRYNKTRCFDPFPFPASTAAQTARLRELGEQLDTHRQRQQELHPKLTMTGMYNVLEALRRGEPLSAKDKVIHEQGLVSVLAQIHDEIDAAVLEAYGWSDLAPALVGKPGGTTPSNAKDPEQIAAEEELLQRLVDLNTERAAEEANGHVRWLRPEFQNPQGQVETQDSLLPEGDTTAGAPTPTDQRPWPKKLPEQVQAVRTALADHPGPATPQQIARRFQRAPTRRVEELLTTLAALGQAREVEGHRFAVG